MTSPSAVAGVVLAAGRSRRFVGTHSKLMLEWQGESLLRRVLRTALASRLSRVVLVLGHAADDLRGAAAGLDVETVVNPRYREGQSTSIRAGLQAVATDADAAMFIPADQPILTAQLVDRLIEAYEASRAPVVLPVARTPTSARRGAPVLWDRALFNELARLEGDVGGRSLLRRPELLEMQVLEVPADHLELEDVDTPDDYQRLRSAVPYSKMAIFKSGFALNSAKKS